MTTSSRSPEPGSTAERPSSDAIPQREGPSRVEKHVPRAPRWLLFALPLAIVVMGLLTYLRSLVSMPGESFAGPLPAPTPEENDLAVQLRADVEMLAGEIGERNHAHPRELLRALEYIERRLGASGDRPQRESYDAAGQSFANAFVDRRGQRSPEQVVVVGAHYDSVLGSPGANDNGTGVAALLVLAALTRDLVPQRTLRFVAFANEEPPHYRTDAMGSLVHARRCKQRGEDVVGMLALETMGYYRDTDGTQHYPPPLGLLYPKTGNFIGFVANTDSRPLLHSVVAAFRDHTHFPSQGVALPPATLVAGLSDHWSFWQQGYPGLMVTDTAMFRYPHYHTAQDTPDQVDYERLARVVRGLLPVVKKLVE